jgi:hypothetical protein
VKHSCVIPPTWCFTNQQKFILMKERNPKLAKEWELGYGDGLGKVYWEFKIIPLSILKFSML